MGKWKVVMVEEKEVWWYIGSKEKRMKGTVH